MNLFPLKKHNLVISSDALETLTRTLEPLFGELTLFCRLDLGDSTSLPSLRVCDSSGNRLKIEDRDIVTSEDNVSLDYLGLTGRRHPDDNVYIIATIAEARAEGWYQGYEDDGDTVSWRNDKKYEREDLVAQTEQLLRGLG